MDFIIEYLMVVFAAGVLVIAYRYYLLNRRK